MKVSSVKAKGFTWSSRWGQLCLPEVAKEPIGDIRQTDLTSQETYELAVGIEEERDA